MNETRFGLPVDASVDGWRVDRLMATTTVFVVIMFIATIVWILWAWLRHGKGHAAQYDPGNARRQALKALALSAVIFLVVDGNLFVNGLRDLDQAFWNFGAVNANPRAVRIQINAHQWAWDARYPGPDNRFGTADDIVTLNDIRIPVGTPVVLQLAATDVLHSFSLPNFRIKQDAVPGMINQLWWQAKDTGVFDIVCAQHCGVNHYKMRGKLTVLPPDEFAAWAAEASALSRESYDERDRTANWSWDWDKARR
ncbi:MAG TPA: cytochrome C oxidase subunit II [Polyangia bacterium]